MRPSFSLSSAAIRSSPHVRLAAAMSAMIAAVWPGSGDDRSARLHAPEQARQVAMPAYQRLGAHNREQVAPLDQSGQRNEGDP